MLAFYFNNHSLEEISQVINLQKIFFLIVRLKKFARVFLVALKFYHCTYILPEDKRKYVLKTKPVIFPQKNAKIHPPS
jgi:hypothetical protein